MKASRFSTHFVMVAAISFVVGCGSTTSSKQYLTLTVYTAYVDADDAEGNASPKSYEVTFEKISLTRKSDGTSIDFISKSTDPFRIIDRPQILHEESIKDYVLETFSSAQIYFSSDITVTGKYSKDIPLTLSNNVYTLNEDMTVTKSGGLSLEIKINWKNTVLRDEDARTEEFSLPTFKAAVK